MHSPCILFHVFSELTCMHTCILCPCSLVSHNTHTHTHPISSFQDFLHLHTCNRCVHVKLTFFFILPLLATPHTFLPSIFELMPKTHVLPLLDLPNPCVAVSCFLPGSPFTSHLRTHISWVVTIETTWIAAAKLSGRVTSCFTTALL